MLNITESFALDDILLIPKYSTVSSRSKIDLSVELTKGFSFSHPVVPANMKTITEMSMAKNMSDAGGMAIFHRFAPIEKQLQWLDEIKLWSSSNGPRHVGFSVGVKEEDYKNAQQLIEHGANILCVDIAHAHSQAGVEMTKFIARQFPGILLIAGNIATGDGAKDLWKAGADVVKCGVGAGSICLTRINTGNGVPSITSLSNSYDAKRSLEKEIGRPIFLMMDGGLHSPGCVAKSLCFADMVMIGNMVAGTDEAVGEKMEIDGVSYATYSGSSTHRGGRVEGVEGLVKTKGAVGEVIGQILEGVASCCSYQGVSNLKDLKIDPRFVRITSAGMRESGAHDLEKVIR